MTLICTHLNGSVGFLGVSDILLTAEGDSPVAMALPLRLNPIFHKNNGYSLAGAAQKSVILGKTLFSWSGRQQVANRLLNALACISGQGENFVSREELFRAAGLSHDDASRTQIVYHYLYAEYSFSVWGWRCSQKKIGKTDAIFGGSGGPAYADMTTVFPPNEEASRDDVTSLLNRAIIQLVSEATSDDTLDQRYGGWIELTVCRGDHFAKAQYAVKLWEFREGKSEFSSGPLIYNYYCDHDLFIVRYHCDPIEKRAADIFMVRDPFHRGTGQTVLPSGENFIPLSIFHIVIDRESGSVDVYNTAGDNMGFDFSFHDNGEVIMSIEPRFWEIISGREMTPGTWLVE